MKLFLIALTLGGLALAEDKASAPLPRESQLEFQILAAKEKDVADKVQAIYDLLIGPVNQARSEAVKHACELVGIAPFDTFGKPACEVKDGVVRKILKESK